MAGSEELVSAGTYTFTPDEELRREKDVLDRLATIYKGQNRLLRSIAGELDRLFPPDEYGKGHGTGHTAPGDVVRGYLVTPADEAERVTGG